MMELKNESLNLKDLKQLRHRFVEFTSLLRWSISEKQEGLLRFTESENQKLEKLHEELNNLREWAKKLKEVEEWTVWEVSVIIDWEELCFLSDWSFLPFENNRLEADLLELIKKKEEEISIKREKLSLQISEIQSEIDELDKVWKGNIEALKKINQNNEKSNNKSSPEDVLSFLDKINEEDYFFTRMKELCETPWVFNEYKKFLEKNREWISAIEKWEEKLEEVFKVEKDIEILENAILEIKVIAYSEYRVVNTAELSKISQIQDYINREKVKLDELLSIREIAMAYRFYILKKYKLELDTRWFINFPSRKKVINQIVERILLWWNVFLTWPTWTWKTVLAKEAVKIIEEVLRVVNEKWDNEDSLKRNDIEIVEISWSKLLDELEECECAVVSGHEWVTNSDLVMYSKLKGKIETTKELSLLLRAWASWKIPIIDEINLIPEATLMRLKEMVTRRPGWFFPQEDPSIAVKIRTTSIIWTWNVSEKDENREDIWSACLRIFIWKQLWYLSSSEKHDACIVQLMRPEWYIDGISRKELSKGWVIYALIKAIDEIEDSYIWKWSWHKVKWKTWVYLQKAVLETWKMMELLRWAKESWIWFTNFIKRGLIEFTSNGWYTRDDTLLLIQILNKHWLIWKEHLEDLKRENPYFAESDIKSELWYNPESKFKEKEPEIISPNQLITLNPDEIKDFDNLESIDKWKQEREFISNLKNEVEILLLTDFENDDNLLELLEVLKYVEEMINKDKDYNIEDRNLECITIILWYAKMIDEINTIAKFGGKWEEFYKKIEAMDTGWLLKNTKKAKEEKEKLIENTRLTNFIRNSRNELKRNYLENWIIESIGWEIKWLKMNDDEEKDRIFKNALKRLNMDDIEIVSKKEILMKFWKLDSFEVKVNWESFIAIEVPSKLDWRQIKKLKLFDLILYNVWKNEDNRKNFYETYFGEEFLNQDISTEEMPYIIYWKKPIELEIDTNKELPENTNSKYWIPSVIQWIKKWFKSSNLLYEAILLEIIMDNVYLDEKYETYLDDNRERKTKSIDERSIVKPWYEADSDKEISERMRDYFADIEKELWIDVNDYYEEKRISKKTAHAGCFVTPKWIVSEFIMWRNWNGFWTQWTVAGALSINFKIPDKKTYDREVDKVVRMRYSI